MRSPPRGRLPARRPPKTPPPPIASRVWRGAARFLSRIRLAAGGGGCRSAVGDDEPAAGRRGTRPRLAFGHRGHARVPRRCRAQSSSRLGRRRGRAESVRDAAAHGRRSCARPVSDASSQSATSVSARVARKSDDAGVAEAPTLLPLVDGESVAAVRAVACRALGDRSVPPPPPMADDPETGDVATEPLEPTVTALLASLSDGAKSVRLPAW